MIEKPKLGLIEGEDALDLNAIRDLYTGLTGKDPSPEEIAEAKSMLEKVEAGNAAMAKL